MDGSAKSLLTHVPLSSSGAHVASIIVLCTLDSRPWIFNSHVRTSRMRTVSMAYRYTRYIDPWTTSIRWPVNLGIRLLSCYVLVWIPLVSIVLRFTSFIRSFTITGSAVALHCCKAHAKINKKIENSIPCKIVTHEDFTLKLGTRDYVVDTSHSATLGSNRPSGGFPPNRGNITQMWLFWLYCFFSLSRAQVEPSHRFLRWMAQMTCFRPRKCLLGVRMMGDVIWGKYPPKTP